MISLEEALKIVSENVKGDPKRAVLYRGLYVFTVIDEDDEYEGSYDPFYSVNSSNGEFLEFSILTDADISEFSNLKNLL